MPPSRKRQVLRPGFNKFGFKIKKPVERATSSSKRPALQAVKAPKTLKSAEAAQSGHLSRHPQFPCGPAPADIRVGTECTVTSPATCSSLHNSSSALDVPVRRKNVKASTTARNSPAASKSHAERRMAPLLNTGQSLVPSTATQPTVVLHESRTSFLSNSSFTSSRTEAAKSVDVTAGHSIRKRRPDVNASNLAAEDDVHKARLDVQTSLQGERLCPKALSQHGEHEHTINIRATAHIESLPVRLRTPRAASEASLSTLSQRTPSYVRQLKDAAHFTDDIDHSHPPSQDIASIPGSPRLPKKVVQGHTGTHFGINKPSSLEVPAIPLPNPTGTAEHPENSSTPAHAAQETTSDNAASVFTLTSTPPQLVSSSGQYEEYVFTTTYRVPRDRTRDPPQVSVTFPARKPTLTTRDDTPRTPIDPETDLSAPECLVSDHPTRPAAAGIDSSNPTPAPITSSKAASSGRQKISSRTFTKPRSSTPFHRRSLSRSKTPIRHRTPFRKSPMRNFTPPRPTTRSRPTVSKGVTPRRIEQWKKITANIAEHEKRRRLFPRRPIFHQPIKERIALPRLEVFWRNMSDLIADRKLFCRSMRDNWEYIGPCVRKINEGLPLQDHFDMEESCAAARELQRQRFVMFTGRGKLMLTRNAV